MTQNPIFDQIEALLNQHEVVLFMKGTPEKPACGFSNVVVQILRLQGVEYHSINILEDPDMRQGIKDYANWPTIPQIYVKGEFIGGCDILREMHESGELADLLKEKQIATA
ncbi:MAG: Grx4 family monothiol glutaredoxin [Alphaproteobacteria bacterium]|nr:Grx4 family monothiol glutaredoxin [Alphaproteobacteria bacterium]